MTILQEKLGVLKTGRILDAGTGQGAFVDLLQENLGGFEAILGIDTSTNAVEGARKNFSDPRISFEVMDAAKLEFPDESFDMVCLSNSLHHLKDPESILHEMYRVLKPGGYFVLNEMFRDNQSDKQQSHVIFHHFMAEVDILLGHSHYPTLLRHQILEYAEVLGLRGIASLEHHNDYFNQHVQIENLKKILGDQLGKIRERREYEDYKARAECLCTRMDEIGIEFATLVMVIGRK